jgi:hypothetical protein
MVWRAGNGNRNHFPDFVNLRNFTTNLRESAR